MSRALPRLVVTVLLLAGCASSSDGASSTTTAPGSTTTTLGETGSIEIGPADRPATLVAPDEVTGPAPLLLLLHGYSASSAIQDGYLGVTEQAASRGLYVLMPDGTPEAGSGKLYWDASPACCNFGGTPVDDVGYLSGLIDEAIAERPIDPDRVYVLGHSNGGFMAYRLACERAEQIAAIAALAGADQTEPDECVPSEPVSVLHLHGTDDAVIRYDGGVTRAPYPGALETVSRWASRDGCDDAATTVAPIDLDSGIDGSETTVTVHEGCDGAAAVQLDTIEGGTHVPELPHEVVGTEVLDWLLAQSR